MSHKKVLASELRWFLSIRGVLERPDRTAYILERADVALLRLDRAEEAVSELLGAEPPLEEGIRKGFEKDLEQITDCYAEFVQAVERIRSERAGVPACKVEPVTPGVTGRLPTLELPHFRGHMEQWVSFKNMFVSLVDSRRDLTAGQKLAYLLSTLQDEARSLIQHLPVEDDQYATAWELLNSRYNNARLLADAHVSQILNVPRIAARASLRHQLLTPVKVACNSLRTLGLPVDEWSFLLVHIVLGKLPADLRSRFEREHGGGSSGDFGQGDTFPRFSDLLRFLEFEARISEALTPEVGASAPGRTAAGPTGRGGRSWEGGHRVAQPRTTGGRLVATSVEQGCRQCGHQGHDLLQCRAFKQLPVSERRLLVKRQELCFSCAGPHFHRDCTRARPCPECSGLHHPLLCMNRNGAVSPRGSSTGGCPAPGSGPPRTRRPTWTQGASPLRDGRKSPSPGAVAGKGVPAAGSSPLPTAHYVAWSGEGAAATEEGLDRRGGGTVPTPVLPRPPVRELFPPQHGRYSPPTNTHPRLPYHPPYYGRTGYLMPRSRYGTRPEYWDQWRLPGQSPPPSL